MSAETDKTNMVWLYRYQLYLTENAGLAVTTVDEHLRSLARASALRANKPFPRYTLADATSVKRSIREALNDEAAPLSLSSAARILDHCQRFFEWLDRQTGVTLEPDLPGYFQLNRSEYRQLDQIAKGTEFTFEQAISLFRSMSAGDGMEIRNKAIIATLLMTGMRADALASLRGKHVDVQSWWINQAPPEVRTKHGKHIRSYCLDLADGLREAMGRWDLWRRKNGFGEDDAFFLPDRFIKPNQMGLGFRGAQADTAAIPWRSGDSVRAIIKTAAGAVGLDEHVLGAHDFRKIIHPHLASRSEMTTRHEVALQLNLGHTPIETTRKFYSKMPIGERQAALEELSRMAKGRTDACLVLAFERGLLPDDDPDRERAEKAHARAVAAARFDGS